MDRLLQPDSNCIDVGCHKGEMLDEMLLRAPKGSHHGFEPIASYYNNLVNKYKPHDNVHIHNVALSDVEGTSDFAWVKSNPAYSGMKERSYAKEEETIEHITVNTAPLDSLLIDDQLPHFIKIDVEGAEYQVLQGAKSTITKAKPYIIFEHGLGAAEHYGTTPQMVFELLETCGLKIWLLSGFLEQGKALTQAEFVNHFEDNTHYYFIAGTETR